MHSGSVRLVEFHGHHALEGLRPDWEDLWERDHSAGPFQHPDWLLAWQALLCGGEPWAIAAYLGERMQALLPLYIHVEADRGTRQATLLGNGPGDRLDMLVAEGADAARQAVLGRLLERRASVWDTCDFRDLPAAGHLLERAFGFGARLEPDEPTPVLQLIDSRRDLSNVLERRLLANLRTARHRAERLGDLRCSTANAENINAAFESFVLLHSARWHSQGEAGGLSDSATRAFHLAVAKSFERRGWMRLHLLHLDCAPIAAMYGFHLRDCSYFYLGGFDPAYATLSPGSLILEYAVREAVREGARSFDFLRGREPYKYAWGAADRVQYRLRLCAAHLAEDEEQSAQSSRRHDFVR